MVVTTWKQEVRHSHFSACQCHPNSAVWGNKEGGSWEDTRKRRKSEHVAVGS